MNMHTENKSRQSDISCNDCHANNNPRLRQSSWPERHSSLLSKLPFQPIPGQQYLQTSNGTPLYHIQINGKQLFLYPKLGGIPLLIPQTRHTNIDDFAKHDKLTCNSCHTRWVPTCIGCHMHYDAQGKQWDHADQQFTAGVWHEQRWQIGTGPATLGKLDENTVGVFLPGMIMTLAHPQLQAPRFIRRFAPITAHTTGQSRSCEDCHHSSVSLGLGDGMLKHENGKLEFKPATKPSPDGLPADAWADLRQGTGKPDAYPRPFTAGEIKRLYEAVER